MISSLHEDLSVNHPADLTGSAFYYPRSDVLTRLPSITQHPLNETLQTSLNLPSSVSLDPSMSVADARVVLREFIKADQLPWTSFSVAEFRNAAWANQTLPVTLALSPSIETLGQVSLTEGGVVIWLSTWRISLIGISAPFQ